MDKQPEVKFDSRINEVLRRLPKAQWDDIRDYAQSIYTSCEILVNTEWGTPRIEHEIRNSAERDYLADIPPIVNGMVWADLQMVDGQDFSTPSARTAIERVKEAERRANDVARTVGCPRPLILPTVIGFVGLHDSILPLEAQRGRTRKADKNLNTALDSLTRRFLSPLYNRHIQWIRTINI